MLFFPFLIWLINQLVDEIKIKVDKTERRVDALQRAADGHQVRS